MKAVRTSHSNDGKDSNVRQNGRAFVRKRNAASPPTTVEIRGIPIHFPFKPYQCQEDYMEKVIDALNASENALLESPTGTGKTLCLLCAALAWQQEQRVLSKATKEDKALLSQHSDQQQSESQQNSNRVPTIIYASRTHSQLSQVVRELRNTRYRPNHAVLGSREQMCVNPKVKKPSSTASDINHDCSALAKERKCRFRNNLDGFYPKDNESSGSIQGNQQMVRDMEDLIAMGKEQNVCPFYYTRSMVENAELVLVPYNYLFDKDARQTTLQEVPWKNAIVIFDEAHNLESFATESASFDLCNTDLAGCVNEINRAIMYLNNGVEHDLNMDNAIKLKACFLQFEDYLMNTNASGAFHGEYMMEIFSKGIGITYDNHTLFLDEARKVSTCLMDARGGGASATSKGAPKLEHFMQCIKRVFGGGSTDGLIGRSQCLAKAKSYRVHLSPKSQAPQLPSGGHPRPRNVNPVSRTLSYWCFAPALAMRELQDLKIRSILVTSGTLSPLPSYCMELGLPFPHSLENPHIIDSDQIHVRVVGKGVSGKSLTSSFERRKDGDYYMELGNTLVSLAKVIPDGMLIFFPSYAVMETCLERWGAPVTSSASRNNYQHNPRSNFFAKRHKGKTGSHNQPFSFPYSALSLYGNNNGTNQMTPWKRLLGAKSVVVEPKTTSDLADAIAEFHKYLDMPKTKGCALMGVCRGKISEGIDFTDNMSRAVVITGLPFPPAFDPKVKLKREYLDGSRAENSIRSKEEGGFGNIAAAARTSGPTKLATTTLSGHEWYSQQAHRAVNQAIGRVIRNKNDYGAVLLLDSRFAQPVNHQGLSKWVRPHLKPDEGMGIAIGSLAKFYRQAEAKTKERLEAEKSIVLQYEDEERQIASHQHDQEADERESFTKVAFVQTVKEGASTDAVGVDSGDTVCYIPPEQVIARVDIDSLTKTGEPVSHLQGRASQLNKANPPGLGSVFRQVKAQGDSGKSFSTGTACSADSQNANPHKGDQKRDQKLIALQFFKKAQELLPKCEFSAIRKSVVEMKRHGDSRDLKSYRKAAGDVIQLVSQREHYFGKRHVAQRGNTMLFLFFELLPAKFRRDVEILAMRALYKKSQLAQLSQETLTPENYELLYKLLPPLMHSLWCAHGSNASAISKAQYLNRAQEILNILQHSNIASSSAIVNAFLDVVPPIFVPATHGLLMETKATTDVLRLKETDASQRGEDSIELVRFRQPPSTHLVATSATVKSEPSLTDKNETSPSQSQQKRAVGSSDTKPAVIDCKPMTSGCVASKTAASVDAVPPSSSSGKQNPYARKKATSLGSYIKKSASSNPVESSASRPLPPSVSDGDLPPPPAYKRTSAVVSDARNSTTAKPHKKLKSGDPVSRLLHQAESQTFVKKTPGDIARQLQKNAPSNLFCAVCSRRSKEPLIGDCGHMACGQCWLEWLKRSETCPVCRVTTKKESLARVVFKDKSNSGMPSTSLSQI